MTEKPASKKKAPYKSAGVKTPKRKPGFVDNGNPPVIFDDGGCTRIRQIGGALNTLSSSGTATIFDKPTAMKVRYIDTSGDAFGPLKIPSTAVALQIMTDLGTSVLVTIDPVQPSTTITLQNGVTVTTEVDHAGQRSYRGSDTGGIKTIAAFDKNGSPVFLKDTTGSAYCMLHLKFI